MSFKVALCLALIATVITAELLPPYSLDKPDVNTAPDSHSIMKKDYKSERELHPVFREAVRNENRAMAEVARKDEAMLGDQPSGSTEVNRVDNLGNPNYGYAPNPVEVAYPDIPYAPAYGYEHGYPYYDLYDTGLTNYLENDTSTSGFLWNLVPKARTFVGFVSHTINWLFSSLFVLLLGSVITIGVCTYTNLCSFTFHGIGPIHEEMRSLITPDRLEKISTAADFVKTAINKYQKIQQLPESQPTRKRRAIFYY